MEIFDCTKKDVSVQTLSLNDPFINFGWEPKGYKFYDSTRNVDIIIFMVPVKLLNFILFTN